MFAELSDADFEVLVADLFGHEFERRFEAFAPGADGGIDAASVDGAGRHVIQCKHYRRSSFSHLKAQVEKLVPKLESLLPAPQRFDLVTSMELTSANKDQLVSALGRFATGHENVWGYADLRSLLRRHEEVERTHVKLWLRSSAQLERLLNNASYERTHSLLRQVEAALPRYVQTAAMADASKLLAREKVCIIAGPPGVGKTTLAHLLLLQAIEMRLEPFEVVSDIEEAWRLYKPSESQVFLFDDFLGRTFVNDSANSDARSLVRFVTEVTRQENKRLILTTREYVLSQARGRFEDLHRYDFDSRRFLLTLDRYGKLERARIFYNHVWASDVLGTEARKALLRNRGYRDIVSHPNYNPRLIEWITGLAAHRPSQAEQSDYVGYCLSVLDHPTQLWEHAFERGLDPHAKALLLSLLSMRDRTALPDLETGFERYCSTSAIGGGQRNFLRALKHVEDSFVRIQRAADQTLLVTPLNPSLVDYLALYVKQDHAEFLRCIRGAAYFEQLASLWAVTEDNQSELRAALVEQARSVLDGPGMTLSNMPTRFWGQVDNEDPAADRLSVMCTWVTDDPGLRQAVERLIDEWVSGRADRRQDDAAGLRLLAGMHTAGLSLETLGRWLKDSLTTRGYKAFFEWDMLGDVHRLVPAIFDEDDWGDLQEEFTSQLDDVYADATAFFDDLDDVDMFEVAASGMEVVLDDDRLAEVRDNVEAMVEANREEYDPEPDYHDDGDRWSGGASVVHSEDDRVDALFERLGDD